MSTDASAQGRNGTRSAGGSEAPGGARAATGDDAATDPTRGAGDEAPHPAREGRTGRRRTEGRTAPGRRSLLVYARRALSHQIDRADARRQADRATALRYEPPAEADAPASTASVELDGPVAVEVRGFVPIRSAVVDSLPWWLVRGGMAAWLGLGLIIVIALVFFATFQVIPVFVGVFLALVFTSILQPMVNVFARVMPRYPATFLALLSALGFVAGMVAYVVTSVTSQWNSLAEQFSTGVDTLIDFLVHGPLPLHLTQQELMNRLQGLLDEGQDYIQSNAPTLAGEVLSNASAVVDVFAVLALALFSTIFFLASGGKMWLWFLNELPSHLRRNVHRAAGAGWYTFAGYARGTVLVALTDAIMAGIFLQIVGVPLAAPLAVLVFIGAFIPLVGAPAAMIVAMMVALASQGFITMIVVCLGVAGIGQIEGHVLQPLIMGRQVSLHPVVVIIAVALGTYSAGLLGAIIAVPLVSVAWSVYSELHVRDAPVVGDLPRYQQPGRS